MFGYDEFYYSTVCHICKIRSKDLKTCESCKLYRYCSVEHQKIHWPRHKKICKFVCGVIESSSSSRERSRARIKLKITLETYLKRPLIASENQMWMFPRVCPICLEDRSNKLFDCLNCPSASYCSEAHQRAHKPKHLNMCSEMQKQYIYYCSLLQEIPKFYMNIDMNIPLSSIEKLFENAHRVVSDSDIVCLRNAERLSHVMTVLQTLKKFKLLIDNEILQNSLIIHIIGATFEYDNFNRQIVELLFHWLPNIEKIKIMFIGPELQINEDDSWKFCENCKNKNYIIQYENAPVSYTEYLKTNDSIMEPDIIGIFNCGFNEYFDDKSDPWLPTLPLLLTPDVPVFFTSYTSNEALNDFNKLMSNYNSESINVLAKCHKNKYRSPIPLRDWIDCDSIYYNNYYLSMLKKNS